MTVRIINLDVMEGLRQLPDESVHCVVTSPPYWGLRDYGVEGQIGLEPTYQEHVDAMVAVFREVRRVMRSDGTLWLNYGDGYATSVNGRSAADTRAAGNDDRTFRDKPFSTIQGVLKPKDLCGIPWRVAFALQADGWWLRSDIIWAKPNPMPESVKDRPTKAHEYVFLITKSERYFYDAEAIKEHAVAADLGAYDGGPQKLPNGANANDGRNFRQGKNETIAASLRERRRGHARKHQGFNERWDAMDREEQCLSRNKRSVWTIATAPFPEAHFATFPPELPEICIKAGTSQHGCCAKCGAPWGRETDTTYENPGNRTTNGPRSLAQRHETAGFAQRLEKRVETKGWSPSCSCNADVVPATVLDPFSGAGTTCLVADRLQRNAIGIELNPEYAAMSERRISGDRGALLDLMEAAQ